MNKNMRQNLLPTLRTAWRVAFVALLGWQSLAAHAWPERPVRLVVPAPPGGSFDALARLMAEHMGKEIAQPVIVEYKPGAGGSIAVQTMLAAPADGHTLVVTGSNVLTETPHVIRTPYDPMKDLLPLAALGTIRAVLVASPGLPATDMASLSRYLQATPGKLSFASGSAGTMSHYMGEMLNQRLGTDLQHVPFPGAPPAVVAVMGQQVAIYLDNVVTSTPLVKTGKLKALGIAGTNRFALLPDVPTFEEQGFPEFKNFANRMLLISGAKLPSASQERIQALARKVASSPAFQARVVELGFEAAAPATAEELQQELRTAHTWAGGFAKKLKLAP